MSATRRSGAAPRDTGSRAQIVGRAIAVREPDARVAQRPALGRARDRRRPRRPPESSMRSARNDHVSDSIRSMSTSVRGEARVDPGACRRPVFAVEHAGHEPAGVIGRREVQREPDPGVDGFRPVVAHGPPAVEGEPTNGRAVRCQRPTGEPGRPRVVGRHPTGGEGFVSGPRVFIGSAWSLTESGRMGRFPMTSDLAFSNHVALR